MSAEQETQPGTSRPWFWEIAVYAIGAVPTGLGVAVWFMRARVEGDWSLRLSQLWDSIGLVSLGLAVVAIGLTLTILRVQNRAAAQAEQEVAARQRQHEEVLDRVAAIASRTHDAVNVTGADVKAVRELLGSQINSAQRASQADQFADPALDADESSRDDLDEMDDLSLEGVREGDISNLPLDTHALADDRLLNEVETRQGVFYPLGAVPIGVLADVYGGWEAAFPDARARWNVGSLVGAYRSYSPKALAENRRSLRGAPWFVTFRGSDNTLVTYYLARAGRRMIGDTEKRPVVKRLVGEGVNARWIPLSEIPDDTKQRRSE